ncbi:MAG: hypothetical protein Q4C46_07710 [Bacillota bacterium]|nr:hypothetical protein [Bacillota bacterium]
MKFKKTIIVTCFVIIASLGLSLTGCSNSSNDKTTENTSAKYTSNTDAENTIDTDAENTYIGTWVATVVEREGIEYDAAEAKASFVLTLDADGTGTFDPGNGGGDIKWELAEDRLKITDSVGDYYFTYKNGKVLWELPIDQEVATIYFEKKK